jgi:cell wall-associated NlpC family hydrolase
MFTTPSIDAFLASPRCLVLKALNLYDSPQCDRLSTQSAPGRYLRFEADNSPEQASFRVCLLEDAYPGWLAVQDLAALYPIATSLPSHTETSLPNISRLEVAARLPQILAFAHAAMAEPNEYLWGGTVAPHYDCSGLMQAAFGFQNIWLPRDAYQQEAFLEALPVTPTHLADRDYSALCSGDLVFFGTPQKATHVGLYLGDGHYLHSSGKDGGRNGIGIDVLSDASDVPAVSLRYYAQFRGAGRVVRSYRPGL